MIETDYTYYKCKQRMVDVGYAFNDYMCKDKGHILLPVYEQCSICKRCALCCYGPECTDV